MIFSREILTKWAATRGIDTSLFETEEEWELLDGVAELHCANGREDERRAERKANYDRT